MPLQSITPHAARQLVDAGALLVDIRPADAHARECIAQARHLSIEQLAQGALRSEGQRAVVFHCHSGNRTRTNASLLGDSVACDAYELEGGLSAWKRAGLPVLADRRRPLELQRQIQIAAGSMVLAGTLLGVIASPWFHLIPGFFGAGLVFAGLTGFCGLARVLMKAPWNRGNPAN